MLRSKVIPPHLAAAWEEFQAQAARIERARRALLGCLPVGRVDPAPVPVALQLLRDEALAVREEMGGWRAPEVERAWLRCEAAVDEAVQSLPRAREVAESSTELDALLDAVAGVVEPLDAWHDAERHWLSLRVRRRR
ncbi:MAG TPA: hypothetical protein VML96_07740 [Egibacteraceae bacterium]|nr:hypothetical protein [Egibacteraceae bacterium]